MLQRKLESSWTSIIKKTLIQLTQQSRQEKSEMKRGILMIENILKSENIKFIESIENWKDAIHISLMPLLKDGFITEDYEKAILKITEEFGPYYVLSEDLALIHARPADGVLNKQIAITILKKPVYFEEHGYPVRILLALAAVDSESHLDAMRVLSNIFMDVEQIDTLLKAKDSKHVYEFLIEAEKQLMNE